MGGLFETSTLDGDLKNRYSNIEVLDYNVYGVTHKCKDNKSGKIVAVRIINKKYLEKICGTKNLNNCLYKVRKGIEYMKKLDGDYSLHVIKVKETEDSFYILTDVWDLTLEKYLLNNKKGLEIEEIKKIFKKLNVALRRMVDNRIIHENLKLNNILIKNDNNKIIPLLSDYGSKATLDQKLSIMQSTSQYSAPELLKGDKYNYKVDLWSIGVILYRLYYNEFPYDGDSQEIIFNEIKNKRYIKRCGDNYFNDLIKGCLTIDPYDRMTWNEYFNHRFWEDEDDYNSEDEKNDNKNDKNKEYKYLYQRKRDPNKKYYNVFYSVKGNEDKHDNDNKENLEDLKKIEIEVDKNDDNKSIDNLIYQELTKRVQTNDLRKLILYGCDLENIDLIKFINAENLLELDLSRNEINNIEPLSVANYPKLITLNLSHNNINNIEPLAKVSFANLRNLILTHNLINDIEPLSKVPFYNLDKLKLTNNKIEDIQVLTKVPFIYLTYLDLKNNKIGESSQALSAIAIGNLKYLDLSHNSIKSIEGLNSIKYRNLVSLDLGDNDISNIDLLKDVYFKNISRLSLYDNNISDGYVFSKIPFRYLNELNLSYNKIESVDFINYMVFQNLEKLDLNGNNIKDLTPLDNTNLYGLKEFYIKNNKLKENKGNDRILNKLRIKYKDLKVVDN